MEDNEIIAIAGLTAKILEESDCGMDNVVSVIRTLALRVKELVSCNAELRDERQKCLSSLHSKQDELEKLENHRGWELCAKCEHRPMRGVCKYSDCTVKSTDWFKPIEVQP